MPIISLSSMLIDLVKLQVTGNRPIIFSVPDMFAVKDIVDKTPTLKTFDNGIYIRKHLPKSMRDERLKMKNKMKQLYDEGLQPKWQINFDTYKSYILDKNGVKYHVSDA